jgi:gluconokinase
LTTLSRSGRDDKFAKKANTLLFVVLFELASANCKWMFPGGSGMDDKVIAEVRSSVPHTSNPVASGTLPKAILVMGVSGSGKTTAGERLALELGWPFRDADSFHSAANVAKMSAGTPLTDDDRWPWLAAIAAWIDEGRTLAEPRVVSCSALKRAYRRVLLDGRPDVRLVYLQGDIELIAARMGRRRDHFMPPALLESQFVTLEPPTPDEWPIIVPIELSPRRIIEHICANMALAGSWRDDL